MSNGDLPVYVERTGEQVFGPPYVAKGASLQLFFVDADTDVLNKLIDEDLNEPRRRQFSGASPFQVARRPIVFMFAVVPEMYSDAGAYLDEVKKPAEQRVAVDVASTLASKDFVREVELSVWVPMLRTLHGRNMPGFYLPFVFNDSPASVATGREVYGYPKQMAGFRFEPTAAEPTAIVLSTVHVAGRERPAEYTLSDLLRINLPSTSQRMRDDGRPPVPLRDWKEGVARGFHEMPVAKRPRLRFTQLPATAPVRTGLRGDDDGAASEDFTNQLVKSAPLYFLRQFRDPEHPLKATYQRLIEARFVIQELPTTLPMDDGATIEFHESRTLDLPSVLGLPNPAPVREALDIRDLTFTVDRGKEDRA